MDPGLHSPAPEGVSSRGSRAASPRPPVDPAWRDRQVVTHYPLVRSIAARVASRCPPSIDLEDLVSIGVLGLIDAIDRFDDSLGVPFDAYARIRIRGALIDQLRGSGPVPRSVRRNAARIADARGRLRTRLGRDATREEVSKELGMALDDFDDLVLQVESVPVLVAGDARDTEGGPSRFESVPSTAPRADELWLDGEDISALRQAMTRLSEREQRVVEEYYFHERSLKAISLDLRVTESRVCQIRGKAVERLRNWLDRGDEPMAMAG